jgi:hypothetical protein
VEHACNPNTPQGEAEGCKFEDSLNYIAKVLSQTNNKTKKKKKRKRKTE